jgi:uncharacterized membrane protein YkvA (DUF1232 family)
MLRQKIKERLNTDAKKLTESDIKRVIEKADDIKRTFESKGPLSRFLRDVKLMIALLRDYRNGTYRQIPWYALSAIVAALLYVLSPVDLIPDVIPILGYTDDALMLSVCLLLVEQQLAEYESWTAEMST